MLTTLTIAAAAEPSRGWGGPIALGIVAAIYVAGATLHHHFREPRSPAEGDTPGVRVNTQVSAVSDTDDTDADTGWWGRIVERNGRRVRAAGPPAEDVDEELDLDLEGAETMEDAIVRLEGQGSSYMEIVRHLVDEHRVSESTAKRAIRTVRAERANAA